MSILIKGIDIPEKGTQRVMYITIDSTGLVELLDPDTNTLIEEYYAVPVPPHGRLIDADKLADSFEPSDFYNHDAQDNCYAAVRIVHSAPTIIPASEEE